jgi:serine/threonine protein kinase
MGTVFEARHETLDRRVAIKVLNPDYARKPDAASRFFNEARAVNRIQHPGLVQVWDYGQMEDGTAYIVMEYLEGQTLAARLKQQGGKLPLNEIVRLSRQLASALRSAHEKGVIHRDLKPDNIMIIPDSEAAGGERAKILDFGIAKFTQAEDVPRVKTRTDQLIGTPTYMSPEQCRGATAIDEKTDGYALGVMLFEMLVGQPPFDGEGSGELIAMHIYEQPPKLSEVAPSVPTSLAELTDALLNKDKQQRPDMSRVEQTLAELDEELQFASLSLRSRSGRPGSPSMLRAASRWRGLGGFAGGALLVAAAGVGLTLWRFAKPETATSSGSAVTLPASSSAPDVTPSAKRNTQAGDPEAAATAEPREIVWSFVTEPPGAKVSTLSDNALVGTTPFELRRAAASGQEVVRVVLPGHEELQLKLDRGQNAAVHRKLRSVASSRPRRAGQPASDSKHAPLTEKRYEIED